MSYTCLFYHIVFSTKERRPFLSEELLARACQYMGGIVRNLKGQMLKANGAADHVHLAAVIHPSAAVAEFVGKVKSNSTGWIHETFPPMRDFAWQEGYSAFTVSRSVLPAVLKYIENQPVHHRKMTFQEELIELLERHGIEYDPQRMWT